MITSHSFTTTIVFHNYDVTQYDMGAFCNNVMSVVTQVI